MKKAVFLVFFLFFAAGVFAQRMAVVAVLPFEAGGGVNAQEAASIGDQLESELRSWGTLTLSDDISNAEYLIRGRLERTNDQFVLNATTYEADSGRALNTARELAGSQAGLSSRMLSFAAQVTENVPFPNYLLGKWRAEVNLSDGPLTCILEFHSDRTLVVEQYDTWEHREGSYSLRYQGFGTGTYSFWGHARRTVNEKPVDGFISISFKLEDALTRFSDLSYSRVDFYFNESKTVFELTGGGFGCGVNYSGPSVFPGETAAYYSFTKIR